MDFVSFSSCLNFCDKKKHFFKVSKSLVVESSRQLKKNIVEMSGFLSLEM